jgi:hypothetical protein
MRLRTVTQVVVSSALLLLSLTLATAKSENYHFKTLPKDTIDSLNLLPKSFIWKTKNGVKVVYIKMPSMKNTKLSVVLHKPDIPGAPFNMGSEFANFVLNQGSGGTVGLDHNMFGKKERYASTKRYIKRNIEPKRLTAKAYLNDITKTTFYKLDYRDQAIKTYIKRHHLNVEYRDIGRLKNFAKSFGLANANAYLSYIYSPENVTLLYISNEKTKDIKAFSETLSGIFKKESPSYIKKHPPTEFTIKKDSASVIVKRGKVGLSILTYTMLIDRKNKRTISANFILNYVISKFFSGNMTGKDVLYTPLQKTLYFSHYIISTIEITGEKSSLINSRKMLNGIVTKLNTRGLAPSALNNLKSNYARTLFYRLTSPSQTNARYLNRISYKSTLDINNIFKQVDNADNNDILMAAQYFKQDYITTTIFTNSGVFNL